MPYDFRKLRTTKEALCMLPISFSRPTARAIWKSVKPYTFAVRNNSLSNTFTLVHRCKVSSMSMMCFSFSKNHLSIFVSSCIWSMVYPLCMAFEMMNTRLSVGSRRAASMSSIFNSLFSTKPCMPWPIMRNPFCIASSKFRPMAITSPTDFIDEPNSLSTPRNLLKSQRGILQTT